jgi:dienelactone hydrolase
MHQQTIEYWHGKEKLIGELLFNEEISGKQPAVILYHAFEGRGEFTLEYAKRLAAQGFVVFVADMYGDAKVAHSIDDCFKLVTPFLQDRQLVRTRALLAYETLRQQLQVDSSRISAIGFCFGGMCVLELARSGADLWAGVTMHGVLAKSDLPTRPIKSKLLILHGYKDPQVPPVELGHFAEEMEAAGVKDWIFTFFGNARHSFTDPKTGTFDPEKEQAMGRQYHQLAAERSFRYALDFFQE